jgi:Protein of unknown function (Porph_ging).
MQLKCLYKYNYTPKVKTTTDQQVDTMMLEIGNKSCKFYSYYNYIIDSIRSNSDRGTWMLYKPTDNLYNLYINYPTNKVTVIDLAVGAFNYFEYVEDFEIPKWNILNETQKILNLNCKKATCRYKGRDYIAWYATGIPISRGPYKFAGLPGLILKISDTENLYDFECIAIEKANKPMYKKYEDGIKTIPTTKEKFINMEKKFCENPKASAEAMFKSQGMNFDDIKDLVPDNKKLTYHQMEF